MKIAQVVGPKIPFFDDLPHTPYSIPAMSYLISEELVKRGHKVTVFAPSDSITHAKIAPHTLSSKFIKKHHLMKARAEKSKLYKKIAHDHFANVVNLSKSFDIIHNHELAFLYFAPKANAPVVTTLHYHIPDVKQKEFLTAPNNQFIAISKKQTINFPALKFAGIIHHGIRINDFQFNNQPKNYVGWLGRITPIKGCREAILSALKSHQTIRLAGNIERDKTDIQYLKTIFNLIKKNSTVTYIGKVGHQKKISFLKNAKVILMPIKWEEPFGLVAIESFACGTPIIAFSRGALPEIVQNGKTGFIVKNVTEMAKAIKKIDQINRYDCRQSVETYFNVKRMVDDHEKLYQKIINSQKNAKR